MSYRHGCGAELLPAWGHSQLHGPQNVPVSGAQTLDCVYILYTYILLS